MKRNASYEKPEPETWLELSVNVTQELSEAVSDRLIELGSQGVVFEEVPDEPTACVIKAYYPESSELDTLQQHIQTYLTELRALNLRVGCGKLATTYIAS